MKPAKPAPAHAVTAHLLPAQPARSQVLALRPVAAPLVTPPAPVPPHQAAAPARHATAVSAPLGPLVSPFVEAGGALKFMSLQAATNLPVPAVVVALFVIGAALFILFQAFTGGRDPKLARAPLTSDEGSVGFD